MLDLEEFKRLLLQTRLLAVQDNDEDGRATEFGVDEALFRFLARSFSLNNALLDRYIHFDIHVEFLVIIYYYKYTSILVFGK